MSSNIFPSSSCETINTTLSINISLFIETLKNGIWLFGIPSCLLAITDRTIASFADGYLSSVEVFQLLTTTFLLLSWISLKPEKSLIDGDTNTNQSCQDNPSRYQKYIDTIKSRVLELQEQHLIRQEYILPVPYVCQIYHLLNLKHLETVHSFSLNNLKVINVSTYHPTDIGGTLKFQTVLNSPVNALRIWRQPIVEVELTLHTPYTVELNIPVYNNKRIIVLFHAFPLRQNEHKLYIDIYSDLEWPKPLLQILLHFASCLTLFEDWSYLRKLAQVNIGRLTSSSTASRQETMRLFSRFVDLYGSSLEPSQTMKVIEVAKETDKLDLAD